MNRKETHSLLKDRKVWADRCEKLHVALCQACELLNQGNHVAAHNIIREILASEMDDNS